MIKELALTSEEVFNDFSGEALTRALSVELSNADGEFDDKREYPFERIDVVHRACLDVMSSQ